MKKILAIFLVAAMVFSLVACGEKNNSSTDTQDNELTSQFATPDRDYDENDPAAVLGEITDDFAYITSQLTDKLAETFSAVGTTFEDYKKNKGLVDEWIALALSESDALFARTKENSIAYFKLIAADEDHKYSEFCEDALDEYYDVVCDKAMDEYYDVLYNDAMDDLYDEYYDGIVDDAYDDVEYEEWSKIHDECYKQWDEASSAIYEKWDDESSYVYGLWDATDSAFCYDDNFDVDSIISEYDRKKAEEDAEEDAETAEPETAEPETTESETAEPEATPQPESTTDGLSTDFKAAMDSYETFMDEYVAFMKKYKANPTDLGLLGDYADYMSKYATFMNDFEKWGNADLNTEELTYYIDVQARVAKKLAEVAQ